MMRLFFLKLFFFNHEFKLSLLLYDESCIAINLICSDSNSFRSFFLRLISIVKLFSTSLNSRISILLSSISFFRSSNKTLLSLNFMFDDSISCSRAFLSVESNSSSISFSFSFKFLSLFWRFSN